MTELFDFPAAVEEFRAASEEQHKAERWLARKVHEHAEAEREYRKALAGYILHLKDKGIAATIAADIARGQCADLKYKRDLSEGLKEAAYQSIWRHTANRRDLEQLIDWSKRASFLDAQVPR